MRHIGSIIVSLLLTALVYVLTGIGVVRWLQATGADRSVNYPRLAVGMAAILLAGLCYAVLVLSRLSPIGPVLAGLALFGVAMWATVAAASFGRTVPHSVLGTPGAAAWVAGPVGALLAVPLVATIVSPRRWRRWANRPAAVDAYSPGPSAGAAFGSPSAPAYPGSPADPGSPAYPAPPQYSAAPAYPSSAPSSPAGSYGTQGGAAWPPPATGDELTDPDSTRRL